MWWSAEQTCAVSVFTRTGSVRLNGVFFLLSNYRFLRNIYQGSCLIQYRYTLSPNPSYRINSLQCMYSTFPVFALIGATDLFSNTGFQYSERSMHKTTRML